MTLTEIREKLAAVLAPVDDLDAEVHLDLVDALDPPCLLLTWDEPWIPETGVCNGMSQPVVIAVAGRLEPGAGIAQLEDIVEVVLRRLRDGGTEFGVRQVGGPRVFEIGGISYLAARIALRVPVVF